MARFPLASSGRFPTDPDLLVPLAAPPLGDPQGGLAPLPPAVLGTPTPDREDPTAGLASSARDPVPGFPGGLGRRFGHEQAPRGGRAWRRRSIAAMEEPGLLADDIRGFFRPLRGIGKTRSPTSPATGGPAWGEPSRPSGPLPALLEAPARRAPSPPRAILRVGLAAPTGSTRAARSAHASPPRRRFHARSVATHSSLSPASSRSHAVARRCTLQRVGE